MKKGYACIHAAQPLGAGAELVTIEADLSHGLHAFSIIGLPDKAVEEARDRISSAIRHAGFKPPKATNRRIVLSFSPADLRKEGAHYDVPLALAYLAAAGELELPSHPVLFCGELTLDGTIRPVRGVLPQVIAAKNAGIYEAFVPEANSQEASLVQDVLIYTPRNLRELVSHLKREVLLQPLAVKPVTHHSPVDIDLSYIKGQESAKRALEIAAAGAHNIVFYGPPGTGKTLLARALPSILPPLSAIEILEATSIHSNAGMLRPGQAVLVPPFRAPHHTISHAGMVGGGSFPRAGEVTLAHRGVLFLDEFSEFDARVLESLRQPLEDHTVTISRTKMTYTFPANFMLVAAFNPAATLSDAETVRKQREQRIKISRPIADRLDLWVAVEHLSEQDLASTEAREDSAAVRERVLQARARTHVRFGESSTNATVPSRVLETAAVCSPQAREILLGAAARLSLSPRSFHRTLRVARTIADLRNAKRIEPQDVLEALQYRPKRILGFE